MISCTFENGNTASLRHVTVDSIVIKDGKILLGKRNKKLLAGGKWALLGGYLERDETTADAAIREALEESGWSITNLRLLRIKDHPDLRHEDRQNISFVYVADGIKQTGQHDWETDEIRWFDLADLPPEDQLAFDHAEDIELYKNYLKQPFALPVIGNNLPK